MIIRVGPEHVKSLAPLLEPATPIGEVAVDGLRSIELEASIAISVKRIADALCEGTAAIHVHINTDGVLGGANMAIEDIAFRAGQAFTRGNSVG